MVTYLVGTDGESASEALCDYLDQNVTAEDEVRAVVVAKQSEFVENDLQRALDVFEDRLAGRVSLTTDQVYRGRSPADELPNLADEADADQVVVGLRRHSRTERIMYGSVSHALLQTVTRPVVMVPLPEYQTPAA